MSGSIIKIKEGTGLNTDTAAINEAIKFRARFLDRTEEEVLRALRLFDALKVHTQEDDVILLINKSEIPRNYKGIIIIPIL